MTDYAYTRVSSETQTTASQLELLKKHHSTATLVEETASGVKDRPVLTRLLSQLRPGDRIIVTALDRLGRKTAEILTLIESLKSKKVTLISLREGIDYSTPVGRLVTQILVSVAEMERELIKERCLAGLRAAQARGVKLGRPARIPKELLQYCLEQLATGAKSSRELQAETSISYAYLNSLRRKAIQVSTTETAMENSSDPERN